MIVCDRSMLSAFFQMSGPEAVDTAGPAGLTLDLSDTAADQVGLRALFAELENLGLSPVLRLGGGAARRLAHLRGVPSAAAQLRLQGLAVGDTLGLSRSELRFEVLARLLDGPVGFAFPSLAELEAHIRMRVGIVEAARSTELTFNTEAADRPAGLWVENEDGFAIAQSADLVEALVAATQPVGEGTRYAFSCYRASEYAMLTGIAAELRDSNPELYERLQQRSRQALIKSRLFHDTFLVEYGEGCEMPRDYYVPGDRVWFRNPDERSADVGGYEGSWTIYIGGGHFANFWMRSKPRSLLEKCIEIHHWRDAVVRLPDGELAIDENRVEALCAETLRDPSRMALILEAMLRPRDPSGVYANGGCLDRTREYPRCVLPGSCTMPV